VRTLLAASLVVACGAPGPTRNHMLTTPVGLADVHAPHLQIVVYARDGVRGVWLDTGEATPLGDADVTVIDEDTTVSTRGDGLTILRGTEERRVGGVKVTRGTLHVSPSGKRLAFAADLGTASEVGAPASELVVIDIDDAAVRHIPIPTAGPERDRSLSFAWSDDDRLVAKYGDDPPYRVDAASGTLTVIDVTSWESERARRDPLTCIDEGVRLETRARKRELEVVLVPIAAREDPENLSGLEPRVLAVATDYPYPYHGDGAVNLGKPSPTPLQLDFFTPDCRHAVFDLEGRVYVIEVATGRVAFVTGGWSAALARPRQP